MDGAPVRMMIFNKPEGREGVVGTKPVLLLKSLSAVGNSCIDWKIIPTRRKNLVELHT
jgi:hypothetical protein